MTAAAAAVTLSQAKELVRCLADAESVLLLSPPGVGKSEVVRRAAAESGREVRSLLGTQIAPEDVSGVPKVVFFDVGVPILKVPDRAIRQLHLCGTDQVRTGGRLK